MSYKSVKFDLTTLNEKYPGKYPVVEIFKSIEGEGSRSGSPVVFLRLAGCNLNCQYCDTKYALHLDSLEINLMSKDEIVSNLLSLNCKNITITGGEPLLHTQLLTWLFSYYKNFNYNIETNGTMATECCRNRDNVIITADIKCPSSGFKGSVTDSIKLLTNKDVVKFVAGTKDDLSFIKSTLLLNPLKATVYIHQVYNSELTLQDIAEFVLNNNFTSDVRVGIQLHKIIWDPNKRGV